MDAPSARARLTGVLLIGAVFAAAICGLIYELVAGALSSYLLGDSVTQFSIVIGLFLTSMGIGSFLSRFVEKNLLSWFVLVEAAVGTIGGAAALIGFAAFAYTELYQPILLSVVLLVGILVGLEIPLVVRILRDLNTLRVTLANVLSADYLGALVASVLFPFVLIPYLGLVSAGLLTGLINVLVGGLVLYGFRKEIGDRVRMLAVAIGAASLLLVVGLVFAARFVSLMETRLYQDEIIFAMDTPYQRIVLTRWREDIRLYLNGHLQFSAVDEYRYHEALVLPAMEAAAHRERVLILGGGDGLAAKQVFKYAEVKRIDLVDLDPEMTRLFQTQPMLTKLNGDSLNDPRVNVINEDAFAFLQRSDELFDVILIDLPDPSAVGLGKLYSRTFYGLVGRHLAEGGVMTCQSTSPFRSREAFWCIAHTAAAPRWGPEDRHRLEVRPYFTEVPTFGTWGFILAGRSLPPTEQLNVSVESRYLTSELLPTLFIFPPDMAEIDTPISDLNDPIVVRLYHSGYHKYLD